ncbi:MAG TPA: hypothetical protein VIU85_08685 [Chthoniobacterales bacterium]
MTQPQPAIPSPDVEQLTKLLDLELAQKRQDWKQAGQRAKSVRAASFFFLFLLIVGCLVGGYFVFMRVNEGRPKPHPTSAINH